MKKIIIVMGAIALLGLGTTVRAEQAAPAGHSVDVSTGDWDDDQKLNFEFQDLPSATFTGLRLHLSCGLKNARILYTTDATATPADASAWTEYTEPINLTADCTVRFFARAEGYDDSEIQHFDFVYADYQTATPAIAPDMERTHLVMACDTPGAEIRYTVDGSEPTATSAVYGGPVLIEANGTYRARAFTAERFASEIAEYVVDFLTVATPSAAFENKTLVLSCADTKAAIWYTTNADASVENIEAWTQYTAPLALTSDCTVRFFARRTGYNDSPVATFVFAYSTYQVVAPIISSDAAGTHVVMTTETEGAEIRYTIDGSDPTSRSTLYTAPVEIITNGVFRARAFLDGMFESNISEYNVNHLAVPVPSAVFENKVLMLTCSDPKAAIYYTTDTDATSATTDAWKVYEAPIALTEDCTVRFFARREGFNDSDIQCFSFIYSNYRVTEPTIERNEAGTHIVMATTTEGTEIHYTTDGSDPDASSALYAEPILIECNGTFSAIAVAEGMFDSKVNRYIVSNMAVPDPVANFENKKMVLSCSDAKAQIWYTTNSEATVADADAWTLYSEPISLTGDCTLRFFARRANFNDSDIESLTFVYAAYQAQAPSIVRNAQGTHVVMASVVEGARIRYTSDGSEPTAESTLYSAPVRIESGATYRARVFAENLFDSEITDYIIGSDKLAVPVAEYVDFALVLSSTDEGAQIWYTTDPELTVDNIDAWMLYDKPIPMTEDCTVRFFAGDDDANASDVQTFVFQRADYQVAAPTIERNEEGTHIVMATATEGAEIRYTADASEPTAESALYTEPILIVSNGTFRAKAFAKGMFESQVTDFFVTNIAVAVPYAAIENKMLVLTCSDPEAQIYYTTDDSATPDNMDAWTLYAAPVEMNENCAIHFFARRENFNDSDIETFVFLRANYQVAAPVIERTADGRSIVMTTDTEGTEIRYTTDGSEPTQDSELYSEPVFITMNCTFRARAFAEGLFESAVSEFTVSNMTMMMPHATFENKLLTLAVWDEQASIWYTTDPEAAPEDAEAWTLYSEPLALDEDCTVRFFARRGGFLDSQIATFEFVYADHQVSAPVIEYDALGYVFTIACDTEGAEIRYTTDGSEPTVDSELYTGPVAVDRAMTVRARAFSDALFESEISEYHVDYIAGIDNITVDGASLRIFHDGADLVIVSNRALRLPVYSLSGSMVRILDLESGRTVITDLARGVYIVGGIKVLH